MARTGCRCTQSLTSKEVCSDTGKDFRTKLELAIGLIDNDLEYVRLEAVVFDSWFGSQELMDHIHSKALPFITEAKGNSLVQTSEGPVRPGSCLPS